MSDSNQTVSIRLDIQVPIGATVTSSGKKLTFGLNDSDPYTGSTKKVEADGTIKASVSFNHDAKLVWAQVIPSPPGPFPDKPNMASAKLGKAVSETTAGSGVTKEWRWDNALLANSQLPGTGHDAGGISVANKFVLWYKDPAVIIPDPEWEMIIITFYGKNN